MKNKKNINSILVYAGIIIMIISASIASIPMDDNTNELLEKELSHSGGVNQNGSQIQGMFKIIPSTNANSYNIKDSVTANNGITYITGELIMDATSVYFGDRVLNGKSSTQLYAAAKSPSGNWLWATQTVPWSDTNGSASANSIALSFDQRSIVISGSYSSSIDYEGTSIYATSAIEPIIMMINADTGALEWKDTLSSSTGQGEFTDAIFSNENGGEYIIATGTYSDGPFYAAGQSFYGGNGDVFVSKYDINGTIQWHTDNCAANDVDGACSSNDGIEESLHISSDGSSYFIGASYQTSTKFGSKELISPCTNSSLHIALWKVDFSGSSQSAASIFENNCGATIFDVEYSGLEYSKQSELLYSSLVFGTSSAAAGWNYDSKVYSHNNESLESTIEANASATDSTSSILIADIAIDSAGNLQVLASAIGNYSVNSDSMSLGPYYNSIMGKFVFEISPNGLTVGQKLALPSAEGSQQISAMTDGRVIISSIVSTQAFSIEWGGNTILLSASSGYMADFLWDYDQDGIPNMYDSTAFVNNDQDVDRDGIINSLDNCPIIWNAGQDDFDGDEVPGFSGGDVCDIDIDNDGLNNTLNPIGDGADKCPFEAVNSTNDNNPIDGCIDLPDIDGDGIPDDSDACNDTAQGENLSHVSATGCDIVWPDLSINDIDGDGIPDDSDACNDTAQGENLSNVSATGCDIVWPETIWVNTTTNDCSACSNDNTANISQSNNSSAEEVDTFLLDPEDVEDAVIIAGGGVVGGGAATALVSRIRTPRVGGGGRFGVGDAADAVSHIHMPKKKGSLGSDHYFKPGLERQTMMAESADTLLDDYVED